MLCAKLELAFTVKQKLYICMSNETTTMFQHETDHRMMIPAVLGFPMCSAEFMCFD